MYEKFYVQEIAAVDLSKIYFLKNTKKTCKPNNRDLNPDWIIEILVEYLQDLSWIQTDLKKVTYLQILIIKFMKL